MSDDEHGMSWKDVYGVRDCPSCKKFFVAETGGKLRDRCPWCDTPVPPMAITSEAMERMRVCMQAARLRAEHLSYRQIAHALGLSSPQAALSAVCAIFRWTGSPACCGPLPTTLGRW
jgi:hypothetical protein